MIGIKNILGLGGKPYICTRKEVVVWYVPLCEYAPIQYAGTYHNDNAILRYKIGLTHYIDVDEQGYELCYDGLGGAVHLLPAYTDFVAREDIELARRLALSGMDIFHYEYLIKNHGQS